MAATPVTVPSPSRDEGTPLRVAMVTPEAFPYAKTGGLADVMGELPGELTRLNQTVRLVMPYYDEARRKVLRLRDVGVIEISIADEVHSARLWLHEPNPQLSILFLDAPQFYARPALYGTPGGDFVDNASRFIFLARGALEALRATRFQPDILHAHDWQAALAPAYLRLKYSADPFFKATRSIMTIHNLAYQGLFAADRYDLLDLDRRHFNFRELEFYGQVNFLKAGMVCANEITTVSPTYSREIQKPEYGCGLDGVLRERSQNLVGILNGIDPRFWNPATDPELPYHYSPGNPQEKRRLKEELQRTVGFPADERAPLIGMVTRLVDQKGLEVVTEAMPQLFRMGVQLVILGTGEQRYHDALKTMALRYPQQLSVTIGYDTKFAKLIYAGSDMFLMPSRFEPCGLTQLISLRYGTVPLVRSTGGLADTIDEFHPITQQGNGFAFEDHDLESMLAMVQRAIVVYHDPPAWERLMQNAFGSVFTWEQSARAYLKLYRMLVGQKSSPTI